MRTLIIKHKGNETLARAILKMVYEKGFRWPTPNLTEQDLKLDGSDCYFIDTKDGDITHSELANAEAYSKKDSMFVTFEELAEYFDSVGKIVKVKLNEEYDAIVSKDRIQVGGQEFPISILDELNKAKEQLK
jgi:hypothetical protein